MTCTARNTSINQALDISLIDQNINDEDLVYLHNKSVKVVPHGGGPCEIQKSLLKLLNEKLNGAGRKSLAERTIKKKSITYKELTSLVHNINKPRTQQTLQTNRYLQWSIDYDNFPEFVKDDMINNNILVVPSNIYDLSKTIFCSESRIHSLVLLKHIVTQCMEIDYHTSFDDLKEEFKDCIKLLFKNSASIGVEKLLNITTCIAHLEYLHTIWQWQDSQNWDKITRQPTRQSCADSSPEKCISDSHHDSKLRNTDTHLLHQETETSNGEMIDQPSNEPFITLSPESTIAEKITESQLSMLDKEQAEDTSKPAPKSKGKIKPTRSRTQSPNPSTCSPQTSLELYQTLLTSLQAARTKKTTPLPKNSPSKTASKSHGGARPKETTPLPKNSASKTFSESHGGARPKETIPLPNAPLPKNSPSKTSSWSQGTRPEDQDIMTKIVTRDEFSMLATSCLKSIVIDDEKREATVLEYIHDSKNNLKLNNAKMALNRGHWHPELYFDLLEKAYKADKHEFFSKRLKLFIDNSYFKSGYPLHGEYTEKIHMETLEINSAAIQYCYSLADGVTPVEAINSCLKNLWLATQDIKILLSLTVALKQIFGNRLFNHYFGDNDAETDRLSFMSFMSPQSFSNRCRLMRLLLFCKGDTQLRVGAIYTILNDRRYHDENLFGDYRLILGICTVDKPTPLFLTPCKSKELTVEAIQDILIEQYHNRPLGDKFMKPQEWEMLVEHYHFKPASRTPTIPKLSLLQTQQGRLVQELSIRVGIEKINNILGIHIEFMQRNKIRHLQQSKKDKHMTRMNHHPDVILERVNATPDRVNAIPEKIIKKQTESESELIDNLTQHFKNVTGSLRRYNKNKTPTNAKKSKEKFSTLRLYVNELKAKKVNIYDKYQLRLDDLAKEIEDIP